MISTMHDPTDCAYSLMETLFFPKGTKHKVQTALLKDEVNFITWAQMRKLKIKKCAPHTMNIIVSVSKINALLLLIRLWVLAVGPSGDRMGWAESYWS